MKIIILMMVLISAIFAEEETMVKVATLKSPTFLGADMYVYETCIKGRAYYFLNNGNSGGLTPVFEEINHPILGKIDQQKRCKRN